MAALAPIPNASVSATVIHSARTRHNERKAIFKSRKKDITDLRTDSILQSRPFRGNTAETIPYSLCNRWEAGCKIKMGAHPRGFFAATAGSSMQAHDVQDGTNYLSTKGYEFTESPAIGLRRRGGLSRAEEHPKHDGALALG